MKLITSGPIESLFKPTFSPLLSWQEFFFGLFFYLCFAFICAAPTSYVIVLDIIGALILTFWSFSNIDWNHISKHSARLLRWLVAIVFIGGVVTILISTFGIRYLHNHFEEFMQVLYRLHQS